MSTLVVADSMLEECTLSTGNCLHDGTSKYYRNYQNFQVTTKSGQTLSFRLSEIGGGDVASTLKCFSETIDDICDVFDRQKKSENFAKLMKVVNIT